MRLELTISRLTEDGVSARVLSRLNDYNSKMNNVARNESYDQIHAEQLAVGWTFRLEGAYQVTNLQSRKSHVVSFGYWLPKLGSSHKMDLDLFW